MGESNDTRERIIEVAERLLFERGLSGTSLNDVMGAARLSKGALFHHFKSKEDLVHTVLTRWADNDDALVRDPAARANLLADTPLQEAILFLKLLRAFDDPLYLVRQLKQFRQYLTLEFEGG